IRDRTVTGVQTCALPIYGQSGTLRIGSDPKISIMSIAIETDAREYNWGIRQRGKRVGQKMAHLVFLLFRYDAVGRIRRHFASGRSEERRVGKECISRVWV